MSIATTEIRNVITVTEDPDVITIVADGFTQTGGGGGGGSGTVTSVSVATENGFSGTVANATTTPAITIVAGAITPTTVRGLTITTTTGTLTITNAKTFSVSNTLTLAGTDGSTLNIGTGGTLGTAAFTAATAYAQVANNLSDLANAATARTNLGLGTLATQSGTFSGTSSGTNTGDQDLSSYATTAAVAAGYQPLDSDLTSIAALTTTSFGRGVLTWANAAAGRTDLGLGTLATQSGTFSGTSSGTNTGDQTSIVGITGTFAEFNTAVTDANLARTSGTNTFTGVQTFNDDIHGLNGIEAGSDATPGTFVVWQGDSSGAYVAVSTGGGLTAARSWDYPDADGTFVGASTTQTLTNKTIGASNTITGLKQIVTVVFDGGGSAPTANTKRYIRVPYNATITKWTILGDVSGSAVVDVWKDTYANYPPTVADSIAASAKPTLSSALKNENSTLTGWTTTITAGDVLGFNLDSCTTCTVVAVELEITTT